MGESLTQQRRVEDESRKIVNSFLWGRKIQFRKELDLTVPAE